MKCSQINKELIAYIDGELERKKRDKVDGHLAQCAECRRKLTALRKIYLPAHGIKRAEPSPFLWTRIYSRIQTEEKMPLWRVRFNELIPQITLSAVVMALFFTAILFGIYLGSSSFTGALNQQQLTSSIAPEEELVRDAYLDVLDTIPPHSVAGIYFSLQTEGAQVEKDNATLIERNLRD